MSDFSSSPPAPTPHPPTTQQTSKAAIWSLVTGILGLITWLPAIILGCIGLSNIKKSNNTLGGSGLAIAGIVLGGIWMLLSIPVGLGIAASVATPAYSGVRQSAFKAKNMNSVRQLLLGCRMYAADNDGNYPETLARLYPDYIEQEDLMLYDDGSAEEPTKFIYYPGAKDSDISKPVIASPRSAQNKRIIGYADGSVQQPSESEFQALGLP